MGMMTRITNDPYFAWLCKKVDIGGRNGRPYVKMAMELHDLIFKAHRFVPMDSNRMYDGFALRVQFMERYGEVGSSTNRGPCTMLELLIGIARKMSFLMGSENEPSKTEEYFWQLIRNLRLLGLSDEYWDERHGEFFVNEAVQRVLDRNYGADGDGGMFPLRHADKDQTKVELWYQMQAWLGEHCAIDIE